MVWSLLHRKVSVLVFLVLGVAGLSLLMVSAVMGEVFDLLDGGLSGTGVGAGLTLFGASGVLAVANGWPLYVSFAVAIAAGLVTALIVAWIVRRLRATDDSAPPPPTGLTGVARTRITPLGGEVSLDGPYELERRLATSVEEIPAGARVRVTDVLGSRVRVQPLHPDLP